MPPAFSASRAGVMPKASGDPSSRTFGKQIALSVMTHHFLRILMCSVVAFAFLMAVSVIGFDLDISRSGDDPQPEANFSMLERACLWTSRKMTAPARLFRPKTTLTQVGTLTATSLVWGFLIYSGSLLTLRTVKRNSPRFNTNTP